MSSIFCKNSEIKYNFAEILNFTAREREIFTVLCLSFWIDSKPIVKDSLVVLTDNNSDQLALILKRILLIKVRKYFGSVSLLG